MPEAWVICRALSSRRARQIELFQLALPQIPHGATQFDLAFGHEVAGQFKVFQRVCRLALVQFGRRVQLQGDAGEGLFDGVVELLGQARSFGQNGLGLQFGFLASRNLKLQLLGALFDSLLQVMMGFLKGTLRLLALADGGV